LVAAQGEIFDISLTRSAGTVGCTHSIAANKCSGERESFVNDVAGEMSPIRMQRSWSCRQWLTEFCLAFPIL
jgi:hypothetical protein